MIGTSAQDGFLTQFTPPTHLPMHTRRRFTAKIGLKHRKNKAGERALELICFVDGKQFRRSTGFMITEKYWDAKNRRVKSNHPNADNMNLLLDKLKGKANNIKIKYALAETHLDLESFKMEFDHGSMRVDFFLFYNHRFKVKSPVISEGTKKNHEKFINHLKAYTDSLEFSQITNDYMLSFKAYLMSKDLMHNTQITYLKIFRQYLNAAKDSGVSIHKNIFKGISCKWHKGRKRALKIEELQRMYKLHQSGVLRDAMQDTLHCFLFCCFTSLRMADMMRYRNDWIEDNHIIFKPNKTKKDGKIAEIPLNNKIRSLLPPDGEALPFHDEPVMRECLTHILSMLGITRKITFHSSRHTFATTYLRLKGHLEDLKELMCHSSVEQTMDYVDSIDEERELGVANFDEL